MDGVIISNTTISRPDFLKSAYKGETGGLSGRPLNKINNIMLVRRSNGWTARCRSSPAAV